MIPLLFLVFLQANDNAAKLTREVAESGRVLEIGVAPSERATPPPQIAPGQPPLVAFRYFEGHVRHRFGNLDLVADDAGH
jgi:hypothetical protein